MGKYRQPVYIPLLIMLRLIGILSLLTIDSMTPVKAQSACKSTEIPTQIGKLADKEQAKAAAQTLSQCGASAVPDLMQALQQNPNVQVRSQAGNILATIGTPSVTQLTQVLNTPNEPAEVRVLAIAALTRIAQTNPSTTVGIVQTLTERRLDKQENLLIQISAMRALETIDTPAPVEWIEPVKNWLSKHSAVPIGLASVAGLGTLSLLILRAGSSAVEK